MNDEHGNKITNERTESRGVGIERDHRAESSAIPCLTEELLGFSSLNPSALHPFNMSQFRAKKLDICCYVNAKVIRDHTKR